MNKFIEFHENTKSGKAILFNVSKIDYIHPLENKASRVYFSNAENCVDVKESYLEIASKINKVGALWI